MASMSRFLKKVVSLVNKTSLEGKRKPSRGVVLAAAESEQPGVVYAPV